MFSLSAFFGMSCSIKDAFQRAFQPGVIYDISKYCDAFGVLAKVRKFMIIAFLKVRYEASKCNAVGTTANRIQAGSPRW